MLCSSVTLQLLKIPSKSLDGTRVKGSHGFKLQCHINQKAGDPVVQSSLAVFQVCSQAGLPAALQREGEKDWDRNGKGKTSISRWGPWPLCTYYLSPVWWTCWVYPPPFRTKQTGRSSLKSALAGFCLGTCFWGFLTRCRCGKAAFTSHSTGAVMALPPHCGDLLSVLAVFPVSSNLWRFYFQICGAVSSEWSLGAHSPARGGKPAGRANGKNSTASRWPFLLNSLPHSCTWSPTCENTSEHIRVSLEVHTLL